MPIDHFGLDQFNDRFSIGTGGPLSFRLLGISFNDSHRGSVDYRVRRVRVVFDRLEYLGPPKASRRLKGWKLWTYKIAAFGLAAATLWTCGQSEKAIIFGAVVLVNLVLLRVWQKFEPSDK